MRALRCLVSLRHVANSALRAPVYQTREIHNVCTIGNIQFYNRCLLPFHVFSNVLDSFGGVSKRGRAWSAGLDRAPPPKVVIEYDPEELDRFISMADDIEDAIPEVMVDGNPPDMKPRAGSFEVTLEDGTVLFSKLKDSTYPESTALIAAILARLAP